MSSLLDSLSGHLDDSALRRISGTLGADQGATSKALAAAVPLLLAGLARNAAEPGGATALAAVCQELESAAEREEHETMRGLVGRVDLELGRAIDGLRSLRHVAAN